MDANLILIVAGVGVACFVLGLLVGRRRSDGQMIMQPSPLAPATGQQQWQPARQDRPGTRPGRGSYGGESVGVNLQLGEDIHQLLAAGNKIEAIRIVRERTGMGLKESKETVERLEGLMKRLGG